MTHDESQDLAFTARGLGIHLFNKHDYLDDAKLMSEAIQELFSEVALNRPGFRRHLAAINYGLGGGGYEHEALYG